MTKIEIELRDQLEENISVHKNLLEMSKDPSIVVVLLSSESVPLVIIAFPLESTFQGT